MHCWCIMLPLTRASSIIIRECNYRGRGGGGKGEGGHKSHPIIGDKKPEKRIPPSPTLMDVHKTMRNLAMLRFRLKADLGMLEFK